MEFAYSPSTFTPQDARKVAGLLQERLIALIDLGLSLKHAHWNVVGPEFLGIHEMLDDQASMVRRMSDDVAERIATFGGIPNGLPGFISSRRTWDDYAIGRAVASAHLGALDVVFDRAIEGHRQAMRDLEFVDPVSADLLTTQTGELEKAQWFIRGRLQNTSGELMTGDAETQLDAAAAAATADPLS